MNIHERIKAEREKKMSVTKLAELTGVSYVAVKKWENGSMPSADKLSVIAESLGVTVDYLLHGKSEVNNTQNGNYKITGNNINGNVSIGELNKYNTHLDCTHETESNSVLTHDITLKSMPLLDIDDAVQLILYPNEMADKIKNTKERVVSFVNVHHSTIGVKVSDNSIKNVSDNQIIVGDEVIIEPSIKPRNDEFVVIALNARNRNAMRGIFAKLKIDISGEYLLVTDDTSTPIPLPLGAVICGIVIQVKKRYVDNDLVISRYEKDYCVWDTEVVSSVV